MSGPLPFKENGLLQCKGSRTGLQFHGGVFGTCLTHRDICTVPGEREVVRDLIQNPNLPSGSLKPFLLVLSLPALVPLQIFLGFFSILHTRLKPGVPVFAHPL